MITDRSDGCRTLPSQDILRRDYSLNGSPMKCQKRLFYDPVGLGHTERVFSDYDWPTQTYSTSSNVSTSSSSIRQILIPTTNHTSYSRYSMRRNAADDTLISSYFLASSHLDLETPLSHGYASTSPLTQHDPSFSPLQQSMLAFEDCTCSHEQVSVHLTRRRGPRRSLRCTRSHTQALISPSPAPTVTTSFGPKRTFIPHRNRLSTWGSDSTIADVDDGFTDSFSSNEIKATCPSTSKNVDGDAVLKDVAKAHDIEKESFVNDQTDFDPYIRPSTPSVPDGHGAMQSDVGAEPASYSYLESSFFDKIRQGRDQSSPDISLNTEISNIDWDSESVTQTQETLETRSRFDALSYAVRYQFAALVMKWQLKVHRLRKGC